MSIKYNDETIEIIKSVFPESVIEYDKLIKIYEDTPIEQYQGCFEFIIYNNYISIEWLRRCGNIMGSEFLDKIFILAKNLLKIYKIEYIQLVDNSTKNICNNEICLITISILTTGISWYNKHDYVSDNILNEISLNKKIINKQFNNFIKEWHNLWLIKFRENKLINLSKTKEEYETLKKMLDEGTVSSESFASLRHKLANKQEEINRTETELKLDTSKRKEILQLIQECNIDMSKQLFNNVDYNTTVQEYFNNIWRQIIDSIKQDCNDEKFKDQYSWLYNFIFTIRISGILTYNSNLKKYIKLDSTIESPAIQNKYLKYKQKYLNLKNQLG